MSRDDMRAGINFIKVRKKEIGEVPDGEFSCEALENLLSAKEGDICTFSIGGLEFTMEVV